MTKLLWLGFTLPVMSVLMSAAAAEGTSRYPFRVVDRDCGHYFARPA
jgi:hypothetical protein